MAEWVAMGILVSVIAGVLAFATWIGRMLLAQHRELQAIDAEYESRELARTINRLEHDLGFHTDPEASCISCRYDRGGPLPVVPDRQRR